ncbi:hypothetical protein DV454_002721 [Geotrichum candidum]|nr:hypothetical protein DV454_002721 [Geotrichum candidum]
MRFGSSAQTSGDHYSSLSDSDHDNGDQVTGSLSAPNQATSQQPPLQQPQHSQEHRENAEEYTRFAEVAQVPQTNPNGANPAFNKQYPSVTSSSGGNPGLYPSKDLQHQQLNGFNSGSSAEAIPMDASSRRSLAVPVNMPSNVPITTPAGRFVTIQLTKESFYSPRKKRSRVWEYFDTVDLQSEYFDKRACKQRKNYRYDCKVSDCNYQCYASILNGSTSLLLEHCKKHGIIERNPKTNTTTFLATQQKSDDQVNYHSRLDPISHPSHGLQNSVNPAPVEVYPTSIPTGNLNTLPASPTIKDSRDDTQKPSQKPQENDTYSFNQPANNYKFVGNNRVHKKPNFDVQSTLVSLILRNNLPYSLLEDPDFKKLLPDTKPDTYTSAAISEEIETRASHYMLSLTDIIANYATSISLSVDAIKVLENSLIVQLNGFWIDEYKVHSSPISTFMCKYDDKYEQLCKEVINIVDRLNIGSHVFSITFPDHLNKMEIIDTIHNGLSGLRKDTSRYLFKGNETTVLSFSSVADSTINGIFHELNSQSATEIIQTINQVEGLGGLFTEPDGPELYTKVRVIFHFLAHSENFRTGWKIHCSELPYLDKRSNVNVYYQMIRHVIQHQYNLYRFFSHYDAYKILQFTDKEYELATKFCDIIDLLYTSCENLSSNEQPAIPKGLRLYQKTDRLLQKLEESFVSRKFNLAIKEGRRILEKHFKDLDSTLPVIVASVLDPRYKTQFITKAYGSHEASKIIDRVKIFIKTFYTKSQTTQSTTQPKTVIDLSDLSDDDDDFDDNNNDNNFNKTSSTPAKTDIDTYFQERSERDASFVSVTKWWHDHKDTYPCMAAVAHDFLAIPFTLISDDTVTAIRANGISTDVASIMYQLDQKVKAITEPHQAAKLRLDFDKVGRDLEDASKRQFL